MTLVKFKVTQVKYKYLKIKLKYISSVNVLIYI